jgi:hypothetical protein
MRVFKQRYHNLLGRLRDGSVFGSPSLYIMSVIEFQKRGLPHAHIVLRVKGNEHQPLRPDDIDRYISAELPVRRGSRRAPLCAVCAV